MPAAGDGSISQCSLSKVCLGSPKEHRAITWSVNRPRSTPILVTPGHLWHLQVTTPVHVDGHGRCVFRIMPDGYTSATAIAFIRGTWTPPVRPTFDLTAPHTTSVWGERGDGFARPRESSSVDAAGSSAWRPANCARYADQENRPWQIMLPARASPVGALPKATSSRVTQQQRCHVPYGVYPYVAHPSRISDAPASLGQCSRKWLSPCGFVLGLRGSPLGSFAACV